MTQDDENNITVELQEHTLYKKSGFSEIIDIAISESAV